MLLIGTKTSVNIIMNRPQQLTFPWSKPNKSNFNEYYFDDVNKELQKKILEHEDIVLYGIRKIGKTYLLQALCNYYADKNKTSLFIPLAEVSSFDTSIFDSIENMDIICIDDVDAIKGIHEWEVALFNLINNSLISGCRLVFGSSQNPTSINFSLSDLDSRIRKINSTEVLPINNANIQEAVKKISQLRSIRLGEKELNYLITYTERSMDNLIDILNKLDDLSIEQKRKITIPLIKEII